MIFIKILMIFNIDVLSLMFNLFLLFNWKVIKNNCTGIKYKKNALIISHILDFLLELNHSVVK